MRTTSLASIGAALLLLGSALPASAANTFNVQVTATTSTTIAVTTSGTGVVACNPGTAVTGNIACTNTVTATGTIRSTHGGTSTLTVNAVAATITGTGGSSIPIGSIYMTCADSGSTGTHGTGVFANVAASAITPGTQCASWPGPNVFTYSVGINFLIDASKVDADTYTLSSGWTVVAATT